MHHGRAIKLYIKVSLAALAATVLDRFIFNGRRTFHRGTCSTIEDPAEAHC
jgi:hypothetical protein